MIGQVLVCSSSLGEVVHRRDCNHESEIFRDFRKAIKNWDNVSDRHWSIEIRYMRLTAFHLGIRVARSIFGVENFERHLNFIEACLNFNKGASIEQSDSLPYCEKVSELPEARRIGDYRNRPGTQKWAFG
jgi:hypothetical protein